MWALCARLALWLCARCSCSRSRSRAFWARRPAFASPRTFSPWRQPLRSRVLAASCNVGQHRRGDPDLEVRIVACGFPWRLLLSSRGSSRAQVVVSGHRRVTSMELHTCTSAALWASVGGRNDCRHGLACSFGAIGCGWGRVAIAAATVATIDAPRQDGHHHRRRRRPAWRQALVSWQVGRPVAWPIAADTTSPPHSRHRSLLMVLLWCAAAKWRCGRVRLPNGAARCAAAEWRCGACGCRMSLRACDMWKGHYACVGPYFSACCVASVV